MQPDDFEAVKWFRRSAEQGFWPAVKKFGPGGVVKLHPPSPDVTDPDKEERVRDLRPRAEQGQADAQQLLCYMHAQGYGVPQDTVEAVQWWRKAAEQGNVEAQSDLGVTYSCGEVRVPRDYSEAAKWLRLASDWGDVVAQNDLAEMYRDGKGVPQDYALAHMWFNLAAAKGNADANKSRDDLAQKMTPDQIAEAQRLAREWKPTPKQ